MSKFLLAVRAPKICTNVCIDDRLHTRAVGRCVGALTPIAPRRLGALPGWAPSGRDGTWQGAGKRRLWCTPLCYLLWGLRNKVTTHHAASAAWPTAARPARSRRASRHWEWPTTAPPPPALGASCDVDNVVGRRPTKDDYTCVLVGRHDATVATTYHHLPLLKCHAYAGFARRRHPSDYQRCGRWRIPVTGARQVSRARTYCNPRPPGAC